jgi:ATP-dependent Clp protease adapter protein ClpS
MDWYRDDENTEGAPLTATKFKPPQTHREPATRLLEKDKVKTKRPSMWNIVFYNDDYTDMDFVQFALMKIFHKSAEDALALTMAARWRAAPP